MLFNSFTFIVFFITVTILYYILPHKFRYVLLLIASYIFYMAWRPELIVLILLSTFINFFISKKIYRESESTAKKNYFVASIVINFGLLFIFKYLVFINQSFIHLFSLLNINYPVSDFDIILPMGISFYTFQAASYTFDVYRGDMAPVKNFFKFSLFITFFPQLVAGPIERADRLYPQLFTRKKLSSDNLILGAKYMALGFLKKVVVADRISALVNTVYNSPRHFQGISFIIATIFFAFQIYCDFSGYSDIAVGCAKCLGIDLMQNFRQPYLSKSVREFWQRWHISLSTWFKDYLYIPLGGNRVSKLRNNLNVMITFLVSGMWHGANWTFLIWGGLHGVYQVAERTLSRLLPRTAANRGVIWRGFGAAGAVVTFGLVCFAWIFFRANTTGDAFYIATHLFDGCGRWGDAQYVYNTLSGLGMTFMELLVSIGLIVFLVITDFIGGERDVVAVLERAPAVLRLAFYFIIVVLIMSLGVFYNAGEFIYFQF